MKFENLPKKEHEPAIKLWQASKYTKLNALLKKYKVTSSCITCDKKYINEWMQWFYVTNNF